MSNDERAVHIPASYQPDLIDFENRESLHSNMFWSFQDGDKKQFHLRDFIEILLRRKMIVAIFLITVVTIVAVVTFTTQPMYKSTSTIQIRNVENEIIPFEHDNPEMPNREYYPTQYNILKSDSLAERVIEKLNLDSEITPQKNLIAGLMHSLKTYISAFFNKDSKGIAEDNQRIQAINDFIKHLEIRPIKSSQIVDISYLSPDPVLSAKVANTIADEYAKFMMEIKLNPTLEAKTRLQKEASTMRNKLSDSEMALNKYLEKSQIIFPNDGNSENKSLFNLKLSELTSEMDKAVAYRISKEAIYQEVTKNGIEYAVVLDNPLIQSLTLRYAELESEYFNLLKIHKPAYPKMLQIEKQIESLKRKIQEEEQKILKAVESDYEIAVKREALLSSAIGSLRKDVASYQQKMVHFHMLKREAETNKGLYTLLLKRLKEVDISTALAESKVQIIDKAKIPLKPFLPRKALNIVISIFIGLLGGIFLAFIKEYSDQSVKNIDDIERETRIPVVGAVPILNTDSKGLIGQNSDQHCYFTEALRSFSTFIQFSNGQTPPKKILVTSPLPSDGKTLLATNIAKNYHFSGKGIIIDADMRGQGFHEMLNVDNARGLSSYLSENASLENVIKEFPRPQFDVMTSGPTPPDPSALLNSSRMKNLIDYLSNTYDFVIVDSPPIVGISDSLILSKLVDTVIVVARATSTPRDALKQAIKLLNGVNAKILGIVFNGINLNSRYGYGRYGSSYAGGIKPGENDKKTKIKLSEGISENKNILIDSIHHDKASESAIKQKKEEKSSTKLKENLISETSKNSKRKIPSKWIIFLSISFVILSGIIAFKALSTPVSNTYYQTTPKESDPEEYLPKSENILRKPVKEQAGIWILDDDALSNKDKETQNIDNKSIIQVRSDKNIDTENKLNEKLNGNDQYASRLVYTVQMYSQKGIANAQKQFNFILRLLNKKDLNLLRIEKVGKYYAVRLGKFEDYASAKKFLQEINPRLSDGLILKTHIKNERIIRLYE